MIRHTLTFGVVYGNFYKFKKIYSDLNLIAAENLSPVPYGESFAICIPELPHDYIFVNATKLLNIKSTDPTNYYSELDSVQGFILLCDNPASYHHSQLNACVIQILSKAVPVFYTTMERTPVEKACDLFTTTADTKLKNLEKISAHSSVLAIEQNRESAMSYLNSLDSGLKKQIDQLVLELHHYLSNGGAAAFRNTFDLLYKETVEYSHLRNKIITPTPQSCDFELLMLKLFLNKAKPSCTTNDKSKVRTNNLNYQPKVILGGTIMASLSNMLTPIGWAKSMPIIKKKDNVDHIGNPNHAITRLLYNSIIYDRNITSIYDTTSYRYYIARDEVVDKVIEKVNSIYNVKEMIAGRVLNKEPGYYPYDPLGMDDNFTKSVAYKLFILTAVTYAMQEIIDLKMSSNDFYEKVNALKLSSSDVLTAIETASKATKGK